MYESDGYRALSRQVSHWELVKRYIDMARVFRSMTYGARLTMETQPKHQSLGAHTVVLETDNSLRTDLLNFLADRCETIAAKINESPPGPVDVKEACRT